eukprot:scaffold131458_cov70-Attheya_sp.AAC.2
MDEGTAMRVSSVRRVKTDPYLHQCLNEWLPKFPRQIEKGIALEETGWLSSWGAAEFLSVLFLPPYHASIVTIETCLTQHETWMQQYMVDNNPTYFI